MKKLLSLALLSAGLIWGQDFTVQIVNDNSQFLSMFGNSSKPKIQVWVYDLKHFNPDGYKATITYTDKDGNSQTVVKFFNDVAYKDENEIICRSDVFVDAISITKVTVEILVSTGAIGN